METRSKGKASFRKAEEVGEPTSQQGKDQKNRLSKRLRDGVKHEHTQG